MITYHYAADSKLMGHQSICDCRVNFTLSITKVSVITMSISNCQLQCHIDADKARQVDDIGTLQL